MIEKKERRGRKRYVLVEDVTKILKNLKTGEIVIDLSLSGARLISLDPKKMGEETTFDIELPNNLGILQIAGKTIRSKILKIDKTTLHEIGVQFINLTDLDSITLKDYISYLERNEIITEGKEKIKALLTATKKLKKNLLVLKCSLSPPKEKKTTQ